MARTALQIAQTVTDQFIQRSKEVLRPLSNPKPINNKFVTYGFDDSEPATSPATGLKVRQRLMETVCDRFTATDELPSIRTEYGSKSYDINKTPQKKARGKPKAVYFNSVQHPDDAAKRVLEVALHRFNYVVSSEVDEALEITHTRFPTYNSDELVAWMMRQQKSMQEKIWEKVSPIVHAQVRNSGGYTKFYDAGYKLRVTFWQRLFLQNPIVCTLIAFDWVSETIPFCQIYGSGEVEPGSVAAAMRAFNLYKFGEICDDIFLRLFREGSNLVSKKLATAAWRSSFYSMLYDNKNVKSISGLPADWRDLPGRCFLSRQKTGISLSMPKKKSTGNGPLKRGSEVLGADQERGLKKLKPMGKGMG